LNEARYGTRFLTEIALLGKPEQKGLAQILGKLEKFNVRLVCAATGSLPALVDDGQFDAYLYNQISGLTIRVPSIADHAEDIPDVAATLLTQLVDANEVPLKALAVGALNVMRNLDWPGNLPVLQNVVKTLALTSLSGEITGDDVNRLAREFRLGPREAGKTEGGVYAA